MFSGDRFSANEFAFERDQANLFVTIIVNAVRKPVDESDFDT